MPPSHPDKLQTTMACMDKAMQSIGMECTILTFDLQLYIVGCLVKWSDQERWQRIILRPEMIHALQSFLACIVFLVKASGLDVLLWAAFGGFTGILNGKSWPNPLIAYLTIAAALMSNILKDKPTTETIMTYHESARSHPTGSLWVDCLIKPTMIAHSFVRSWHEGDILLEEHYLKEMLPYFFASGHDNYARYVTWHLREMANLLHSAKKYLLDGGCYSTLSELTYRCCSERLLTRKNLQLLLVTSYILVGKSLKMVRSCQAFLTSK